MKYFLDPEEGPPFPKFDYQMEAMRNLGWEVSFLGIRKGKIYLCTGETEEEITAIPFSSIPGIGRLSLFNALFRAVRIIAQTHSFSLAYVRLMPAVSPVEQALDALKASGTRLVMEIPTFPPEREEEKETRLHRKLFFSLARKSETRMIRKFDLLTLIGREKADEYRGVPALNITNGISLTRIQQRVFTPIDHHIHLLGVANIQVMNAYDRVIEGIRKFQEHKEDSAPDIHFHIVGPDRDGTKEKLVTLVKTLKMEKLIHFEGPAFASDLESYFSFCDIAVASMGLHRIGHTGIATLKAREYLAHGIPYLASGTDPIIPQDRGWSLTFPQDDEPLDMNKVISFIEEVRKKDEIGSSMREFARVNLSWESQFEHLFKALAFDYNTVHDSSNTTVQKGAPK